MTAAEPAAQPLLPAAFISESRLDELLKERQLAKLVTEVEAAGFAVISQEQAIAAFCNGVAQKLNPQVGELVYQGAGFDIPLFPLGLAKRLFPESALVSDTPPGTTTWKLKESQVIDQAVGSLVAERHPMFAGSAKALIKPSETAVRVIARIHYPLKVSHVAGSPTVAEHLHVSLLWVLADEMGEIHYPKDSHRRPIAYSAAEVAALRQNLLADARALHAKSVPMSAAWLGQLGLTEEAAQRALEPMTKKAAAMSSRRKAQAATAAKQAEARKAAREQAARSGRSLTSRAAKPSGVLGSHYDVKEVLKEVKTTGKAKVWYLVEWEHYEEGWEVWRPSGDDLLYGIVGDPIRSWEPQSVVRGTQALEEWKAKGEQTQLQQRLSGAATEPATAAAAQPAQSAEEERMQWARQWAATNGESSSAATAGPSAATAGPHPDTLDGATQYYGSTAEEEEEMGEPEGQQTQGPDADWAAADGSYSSWAASAAPAPAHTGSTTTEVDSDATICE